MFLRKLVIVPRSLCLFVYLLRCCSVLGKQGCTRVELKVGTGDQDYSGEYKKVDGEEVGSGRPYFYEHIHKDDWLIIFNSYKWQVVRSDGKDIPLEAESTAKYVEDVESNAWNTEDSTTAVSVSCAEDEADTMLISSQTTATTATTTTAATTVATTTTTPTTTTTTTTATTKATTTTTTPATTTAAKTKTTPATTTATTTTTTSATTAAATATTKTKVEESEPTISMKALRTEYANIMSEDALEHDSFEEVEANGNKRFVIILVTTTSSGIIVVIIIVVMVTILVKRKQRQTKKTEIQRSAPNVKSDCSQFQMAPSPPVFTDDIRANNSDAYSVPLRRMDSDELVIFDNAMYSSFDVENNPNDDLTIQNIVLYSEVGEIETQADVVISSSNIDKHDPDELVIQDNVMYGSYD